MVGQIGGSPLPGSQPLSGFRPGDTCDLMRTGACLVLRYAAATWCAHQKPAVPE